MAVATFAAGCFWGVQAGFDRVRGVRSTEVGYTGGTTPRPTYRQVCLNMTGHAEAVRVEYDPDIVSYDALLGEFFALHDPTQRNRQGPDIGSQYRSAIFVHTPDQELVARAAIARREAEGRYKRPIVTEVVPAREWWPAEEYHQKYFAKHGRAGCALT